ncbi:MAG: hypothetical protein K9L84_04630 [Candidatus Omnitrophica bacterium]|nr:hypothetical protein [Candidatus Omnitrophota bacterium]MCF7894328.1 hypothetical protein [Candidatus Omnitrophota bacterium]
MKKGFVLIVIFGVLIVISLLAVAAINLMRQQSRVTEHRIKRKKGILAAQAGMIHAIEELRKNNDPSGNNALTINGLNVDIDYTDDNSGPKGTDPVTITISY